MLPHVCLSFPVSHWSIDSASPATEFTLQCGTCWEQGFVSSSDQHRDAFLESQISRHFMFPVAVVNYPMRSFMFLEELPPICRVPAMLLWIRLENKLCHTAGSVWRLVKNRKPFKRLSVLGERQESVRIIYNLFSFL